MSDKLRSIVLAGVAVGVVGSLLSAVPFIGKCLGCLSPLIAGLLAVWHYNNTYALTIRGGEGAGMGAMAAVVATVVSTLITFIYFTVAGGAFMEALREGMEASGQDPDAIDQVVELMSSPGFLVLMFVMAAAIYAILGAVGGAIGAALFKRGENAPAKSPDDIF